MCDAIGVAPQFETLRARPDYEALRQMIARYLSETIADPAHGAGTQWFLAALPDTGPRPYQRLFALSIGGVETLRAVIDPHRPEKVHVFLDVAPQLADGRPFQLAGRDRKLALRTTNCQGAPATVITACGVAAAERALDQQCVADAAIALNTELMNSGGRSPAARHDAAFAEDVLALVAVLAQAS
jgi:hypothetical protein